MLTLIEGGGAGKRRARVLCRYREDVPVVPAGRIVRHRRCPWCGRFLGYVERGGGATALHPEDPLFTVRPA
jgi:hypothetical protein